MPALTCLRKKNYKEGLESEKIHGVRRPGISGHTTTFPYVRGELYYDSRYDKIAKNAFTIGIVFPLTKRTEFELYYEDQRDSSSTPNYHTRGIGLVLGLYF